MDNIPDAPSLENCEFCGQPETLFYQHRNCRFNRFIGKRVKLNVKLDKMPPFFFPKMVELAAQNLKQDKVYTVKAVYPASSWCGVELEETGSLEFNLGWFDTIE